MKKDEIFKYEQPFDRFQFDNSVASVFDDMLLRSIPLYKETLRLLTSWVREYYVPGSSYIDIGCSTGNLIYLLTEILPEGAKLLGLDPSEPMIEQARQKIASRAAKYKIDLSVMDALDFNYQGASVITSLYTIQFINPAQRASLIQRIHDDLCEGGLFWISEKVYFNDPPIQNKVAQFYDEFKSAQGYSSDEIARKKKALDGVLIPMSYTELFACLQKANFTHITPIIQWQNFVSFVAIKQSTYS